MLNLANIDAESGREDEASLAYDTLVKGNSEDLDARESRAYLNLRLGRPQLALSDLDMLLERRKEAWKRGELQSAACDRPAALRRNEEAVAEAADACRVWPHPSTARLWQRALLAAGRYDELELDRPDEISLFPVTGAWLTADLRAAAKWLERQPKGSNPQGYRGSSTRR